MSTSSTTGIHRLTHAGAVSLFNARQMALTFLPGIRVAELCLLPSPNMADDESVVEWTVPGTRLPLAYDTESHNRTWFEVVPRELGTLETTLHLWPIGAHTTGPLAVDRRGVSAVFREFEPPPIDEFGKPVDAPAEDVETPPLTLGVITGFPNGIVATEHGVWHTHLPEEPALVEFGTNLGVYLAHLAPPGTSLSPEAYRWAVANWWIGVVGVLSTRAAVHCPCGRNIQDHRPAWRGLRVAAAASGRSLPKESTLQSFHTDTTDKTGTAP
ncbi:hypothetical protein [Embleya sp. AB8]|uniref:hypothetical protein n=1 Tax=Embleya sp. AB8 TaxID=3156304 RepID=UPI003C72EBA2